MNKKMRDNRIAGKAGATLGYKLRARDGFTLAETLLAVLIMLLVTVIVATGMPAVMNAYNKVILGANAKVMLSTAITALHDEIGTAWEVENPPVSETDNTPDTTKLVYFNADKGAQSSISLDNGKSIQIQDYLPSDSDLIYGEGAKSGEAYHLVADKNARMYVTYDSINYANGIVTISGLKVCKKSDEETDEDTDDLTLVKYAGADGRDKDFTIRVITKDAAVTGT